VGRLKTLTATAAVSAVASRLLTASAGGDRARRARDKATRAAHKTSGAVEATTRGRDYRADRLRRRVLLGTRRRIRDACANSHQRELDRAPACIALAALPTKARIAGHRQCGGSAVCEADPEMQGQAGVAVSERTVLLEELPNLRDGAPARETFGHKGTRCSFGRPSDVEGP
jgi:hypothetical protein